MSYKQPSVDIIGDIIASLTFPVTIKSVVNNGAGVHTIEVCDMYHAQPGFEVEIGGKSYLITGIIAGDTPGCAPSTNDILIIKGDAANISATDFEMYRPFFFYGTPIAEGVELVQVNKASNKTPMFWLRLDDLSERFFEDDRTPKERDLNFRLYTLTQADHEKWLTSDSKRLAIDPMHRLAQIFVSQIKNYSDRFDVENLEWEVPNIFPKFGVISINRGVEKSLWHDKLAGVEVKMSLTIFSGYTSCVKC